MQNYPYHSILIRLTRGIAFAMLHRPGKENAHTVQIRRELADFLTRARVDDQIKAVVLTSKGLTFFTGNDLLADQIRSVGDKYGKKYKRLDIELLIRNLGKPIVAAVNGYAVGAGVKLALACDSILAVENAKFYGISTSDDGDAQGYISAKEALTSGFVNRIVEEVDLYTEAQRMAVTLLQAHKNNPASA